MSIGTFDNMNIKFDLQLFFSKSAFFRNLGKSGTAKSLNPKVKKEILANIFEIVYARMMELLII